MNDVVLLLTSCIKVSNPTFVQRNQTDVRLADTVASLKQWLTKQHTIKKIVFCDNSGYSLNALEQVVKEHNPQKIDVEFLSYSFTNYGDRGYAWGELDIYDHAATHSRLMRDTPYVAFSAARMFIVNVDSIIAALPAEFDLVGDFHQNMTWIDQGFYIVRTDVFKKAVIGPMKRLTNNSQKAYAERALSKIFMHLMIQEYRWYPLARLPRYRGFLGGKNISMTERKWFGRPVYNWVGSLISRAYYQITRTSYRHGQGHMLDRLPAARGSGRLEADIHG